MFTLAATGLVCPLLKRRRSVDTDIQIALGAVRPGRVSPFPSPNPQKRATPARHGHMHYYYYYYYY